MPKTIFSGDNEVLVELLKEARQRSGLTQTELASRIGKDQSFVSLVEGSQRRVDVIEFCAIAKTLGVNPQDLLGRLVERLGRLTPIQR